MSILDNMYEKGNALYKQANIIDEIGEREIVIKGDKDDISSLQKSIHASDFLRQNAFTGIKERQEMDRMHNQTMGTLAGAGIGGGVGAGVGALITKRMQQPKLMGAVLGGVTGYGTGSLVGAFAGNRRPVESINERELEDLEAINQYRDSKVEALQNALREKYPE